MGMTLKFSYSFAETNSYLFSFIPKGYMNQFILIAGWLVLILTYPVLY